MELLLDVLLPFFQTKRVGPRHAALQPFERVLKKKPAKGRKARLRREGSRVPLAMSLIESTILNDLEAVKRLIAAGADVNAVDGGRTALWCAVRRGHVECATALVDAKADVDKLDRYGFTPLHRASVNGRLAYVRVSHLVGV